MLVYIVHEQWHQTVHCSKSSCVHSVWAIARTLHWACMLRSVARIKRHVMHALLAGKPYRSHYCVLSHIGRATSPSNSPMPVATPEAYFATQLSCLCRDINFFFVTGLCLKLKSPLLRHQKLGRDRYLHLSITNHVTTQKTMSQPTHVVT